MKLFDCFTVWTTTAHPLASFHSDQSRPSEDVQGIEHFPQIELPYGYILVTSLVLSHSLYVSAALIIIFTVSFATPYEDYGMLVYTFVDLFLASFCPGTVVILLSFRCLSARVITLAFKMTLQTPKMLYLTKQGRA